MEEQQSAGAVVYRIDKATKKPLFLVIKYVEGHWGLPKGHIEQDESIRDTAAREIEEETCISQLDFAEGFEAGEHYTYKIDGRKIMKDVMYLLCETKEECVKLSYEHTDYCWLPYKDALKKITFKGTKKVLESAEKFLRRK